MDLGMDRKNTVEGCSALAAKLGQKLVARYVAYLFLYLDVGIHIMHPIGNLDIFKLKQSSGLQLTECPITQHFL